MARYQRDFGEIPAGGRPPRGLDPNYREGYGGMRMHGAEYQASYGLYRRRHAGELGHSGRDGGYRPGGGYDRGLSDPRRSTGSYDREVRGGGRVFDWRERPEAIRQFNANSPLLRGGVEDEPPSGRRGPRDLDHRYRGEYGNRGMSSSGFSEPWARGPMRGAR